MAHAQSPSQTSGPMFGFGLMFEGSEHAVDPGSPGAIRVTGRLIDGDGEPIAYPQAFLEMSHGELWARARTDENGEFEFVVAKPEPGRTPDGQELAPYLNVMVFGRGFLAHLLTRLYFPDEAERNAADPVLASVPEEDRGTLIAKPDGDGLRFDIVTQGEGETAFFAY